MKKIMKSSNILEIVMSIILLLLIVLGIICIYLISSSWEYLCAFAINENIEILAGMIMCVFLFYVISRSKYLINIIFSYILLFIISLNNIYFWVLDFDYLKGRLGVIGYYIEKYINMDFRLLDSFERIIINCSIILLFIIIVYYIKKKKNYIQNSILFILICMYISCMIESIVGLINYHGFYHIFVNWVYSLENVIRAQQKSTINYILFYLVQFVALYLYEYVKISQKIKRRYFEIIENISKGINYIYRYLLIILLLSVTFALSYMFIVRDYINWLDIFLLIITGFTPLGIYFIMKSSIKYAGKKRLNILKAIGLFVASIPVFSMYCTLIMHFIEIINNKI